ncbi:hypothetical protein [Chelativorans sp. Marseille-P2723]|uniref:hypothetical protein n=1 Tax=Chelativorans sp. Marseille-P2723 TaxID=2709133 RepID=UPI00156F24E9|nr:hypothetical protein [Chelativorans sp. Marseille-P2723]
MVTKDTLFKPKGTSAETKADATDRAFRAIVEDETRRRDAKTERLRQARLEKEAQEAAEAAAEKPKTKGRKTKAAG